PLSDVRRVVLKLRPTHLTCENHSPTEELRISKPDKRMLLSAVRFSLPCIFSILLINCGQPEEYFPLPDIAYRLVVIDSIGVELGEDEYMFAWPTDPTCSSDGRIFIVDRLKHEVLVFSPIGDYLESIGREGEGPGEFNMPSTVELLPDRSVLITSSGGYAVFDSTFSFIEQYLATGYSMMSIREILDDGSFTGTEMSLDVAETGPVSTTTLGRWELFEEEPTITFYSFENVWDLSSPGTMDFTESREDNLLYCASTDGYVFYARSSIDELSIHCCNPDGSEYLLIEDENIHRVRKTQDQLDAEMQSYMSFVNTMLARSGRSADDIEIVLDPYMEIVKGMFVDDQERLWVRMGIYPGIVYRVYDFDGNVLFHAEVDYAGDQLDLNNWTINGDENGILAVNTSMEDFQRVYMLELNPAE
ncbi:MAG: 6-bladed beta-propeller, partial [Candidatus Fermentibacteria bacterium]